MLAARSSSGRRKEANVSVEQVLENNGRDLVPIVVRDENAIGRRVAGPDRFDQRLSCRLFGDIMSCGKARKLFSLRVRQKHVAS
jgi:hypothetical protein